MMIDNIISLSSLESELDNMEIKVALNSLDSVNRNLPHLSDKSFLHWNWKRQMLKN
jgi:hypothetical protein